MATLRERDRDSIWHPYTPMKLWPEAIAVTHGEGVYLFDEDGKKYIDAISSWWVNLHGHAHPYIADRVSAQLRSLEHCIFAGFTHEPAVLLAERLLKILPGKPSRIFYSDNGSTAVEVAIKMALQFWSNKNKSKKRLIALESAYHGDTFGAMSVSAPGPFTKAFDPFLFEVDRIPFPLAKREDECLSHLEQILKRNDTAALIVEPSVQGAGGMRMYSHQALDAMFALCRRYEVLTIADEVMTGFGRTGNLFASENLSAGPDITCLSKGLTGGTMPLGVTACSDEVFRAFYDDDRSKTLYHGHSYTANPLACAAGLASLDLLLSDSCSAQRLFIAKQHLEFQKKIEHLPGVTGSRSMGTILAFEYQDGKADYNHVKRDELYRYFIDRGILLRPLGNTLYIMPPYCIALQDLENVYSAIEDLLIKIGKL